VEKIAEYIFIIPLNKLVLSDLQFRFVRIPTKPEMITVWTVVQAVTGAFWAVYKYSYLLTYLLTVQEH